MSAVCVCSVCMWCVSAVCVCSVSVVCVSVVCVCSVCLQYVSVVLLIVAIRNSGPPASQPVSSLTHFSADLPFIWLRVPDHFLWGYPKGRIYQNKPLTTDVFKSNITKKIQTVTADVLARIFKITARRVQSCLDANCGHFQHML